MVTWRSPLEESCYAYVAETMPREEGEGVMTYVRRLSEAAARHYAEASSGEAPAPPAPEPAPEPPATLPYRDDDEDAPLPGWVRASR